MNEIAKIDAIVDEFLNYDGNNGYAFDGSVTDMVDYSGSGKVEMSKRAFKIKIVNPNPVEKTVYLLPGISKKLLGGASHDEGLIQTGATATNPIGGLSGAEVKLSVTTTIDYELFMEFARNNPSHVPCFKLASNKPSAYQGIMPVETFDPFNPAMWRLEKNIDLSNYENDQALKDNFIKVTEGFDFNMQIRVAITLPAESESTITLYHPLILNPAKGLRKTIDKAHAKGRRNY